MDEMRRLPHAYSLLGGLVLILASTGVWAGPGRPVIRFRCAPPMGRRCRAPAANVLGGKAGSTGPHIRSIPPWIPAQLPRSAAGGFHPAYSAHPEMPPTNPTILTVTQARSATPLSASFAPGESTAEGRHVVEWTLPIVPLAAYALSPLIDHRFTNDSHGIWTRRYQFDLEHAVMLTELGGALWFGGKTRIGRTFWRAADASIFTAVTTTAMKYAFSRSRPYQSGDPHLWFRGNCCQSFPSGEVSFQASFVTPFIAEYHHRYPWVWALELLPAYDAMARMKTRGHWQTDVLAAWAIGTAWGIYAHYEPKPLVLSFMPDGVLIGLRVHF